MANKKISELNSASLPLAGTEVVAIVQGGETKKVAVSEFQTSCNEKSHIDPNDFQGTDTEKLQQAVDLASSKKIPVIIGKNNDSDSYIWLVNEAILLNSNTTVYIENSTIKRMDSSRDNIFRSINCGEGITTVLANQLTGINIIGIGDAIVEGADIPRATGDHFKTLSLTPVGSESYGSDAGVIGEKQTGDWRNISILLANCQNFSIKNIKIDKAHAYGISVERCSNGKIDNIIFNSEKSRIISGSPKQILNLDGVDVLFGGDNIQVTNISGLTGDDSVALVTIYQEDVTAGELTGITITGNTPTPIGDITNVVVENISTKSFQNQVRILSNEGAKIYDCSIRNIVDNNFEEFRVNGCIGIGSTNPLYASTSLDDIYNISIDTVRANNRRHAVNIEGALKNSTISNLIGSVDSVYENVFISPAGFGVKDVAITNTIETFGTFATAIADEKKVYYGSQKPIKLIAATAYTLIPSDSTKLLHFTNVAGCSVTVPNTISFVMTFEGTQMNDGQVSFVGGGTMNVRKSSISNAKTASKYSVFGITILSTTESNLFGELELI